MGPVTVVFGCGLLALGLVGYLATEYPPALTPAVLGALLVLLGFLARQDRLRKHVMHLAAMLGLLGLVGGVVLAALGWTTIDQPLAFPVTGCLMALGCAIFEWLCVRSFIDARRARRQQDLQAPGRTA